MVGGYMGKILFVDLSTGGIDVETPDETMYRDFLGGYGVGAKILYDRMRPGVDPLGPENILGFVTGPLTGTPAIIGSRFTVVGKSPLTDTWGDANAGGYFGPYLKFSGYDAIFFSGISEKPVYLFVDEGEAELLDASDLWGKDFFATRDAITTKYDDDVRVAGIGPSGETLALISAIMVDEARAAARSGLAAVMGAKRLKAVAVRGSMEVPLAHAEEVKRLRRKYVRELRTPAGELYRTYGTAGVMEGCVQAGDAPIKNWVGSPREFPGAGKISDEEVLKYQTKKYACWHCPLGCGGYAKVESGPYALEETHKPEYETLAAFGSMLLNDNLESIIKANDICNRYGLDTISTGAVVAFAMQCYEEGLITAEDTGGLDLTWGNHEAIVALTERIARREGFGDVLADGVRAAAAGIGGRSEEYAIHIHGQELPMHDPRFLPGIGIPYQIQATPGRHTQGFAFGIDEPDRSKETIGIDPDEFTRESRYHYEGKGDEHWKLANVTHIFNCAGICMFGFIANHNHNDIPEFLSAVTGWEYDLKECYKIGDRINIMRLLFNLREGLNPMSFDVPDIILGQPPLEDGPTKNVTIDQQTQLADYMKAAGLDPVTAMPSQEKLAELGLSDEATAIQG